MAEKKKKDSMELSRREFLRDAGLVVGGAALGSTALLASCGSTTTQTATLTKTTTVTAAPASSVIEVYDPTGPREILGTFAQRLNTLDGQTLACLASNTTKWQPHRTLPYIAAELVKIYPTLKVIPMQEFPMGTQIDSDEVALQVKEKGATCAIIGNGG